MMKNNKWRVALSFAVILLPMAFGLVMWKHLPNTFTTHWGMDGKADGFGRKALVVFGLPAIFTVIHGLTLLLTFWDERQKQQSPKALGMIFWMIPLLSLFVHAVLYSVALGRELNFSMLIPVPLGILLMLMGNYMPKVKQNATLGIKVSWALRNEENWNRTHRFGGKVMVVGGLCVLLSALLPLQVTAAVCVCVLLAMALLPTLYSYLIYKSHQKAGVEYAPGCKSRGEKTAGLVRTAVLILLLAAVGLVMVTGNIEVACGETSFEIQASYWSDLEVAYAEIDAAEYRTDLDVGTRTGGFGSARLLMGVFQNEEFGSYTLYAYADAEEFVVLSSGERTLVIGLKSTEDTEALYRQIFEKIVGDQDA